MNPRIRLRQPIIPLMIAFVLGLQLMGPSRVWTILLVTFGGIFLIAWQWTRLLGRDIQLRRETRLSWVQVGGQIEERLILSNTSLFPAPYIEFIDHSTMPDFNASRITGISAGAIDQWTVTAYCKQRGMFTLGDAHIKTGDPFGLFEVDIPASQRTSILVLPQSTTLPEFNISPSGLLGEGQPRRNAPQQTIHASTVREYAEGDSTKLIHWPTTARMNKPFVRLMENAPDGHWWILLDLDKTNMFGTGWDSIEEQSVAIATSLADLGLRSRKSVGMISNGRTLAWLPPQKGEGQRWEIMQALAIAKPGTLTLSSLLEKMHPQLGKHHSLIVITASQKIDWLKSTPSLINRGVIPTVILLDPATFGSETSAQGMSAVLGRRGIQHHIIPRGLIQPPKIVPTTQGKWTWRATSTGEIVPVQH